jgi:hypothetical protein
MKKALFLTAIICFSLIAAEAQLANTKWQGAIKIPSENGSLVTTPVTWIFQKDTASVNYNSGGDPDVMVYKVEKNIITFRKVSGNVPCDTVALLTCSYEIKHDQLFLTRIQDACTARAEADASQPFDRVK